MLAEAERLALLLGERQQIGAIDLQPNIARLGREHLADAGYVIGITERWTILDHEFRVWHQLSAELLEAYRRSPTARVVRYVGDVARVWSPIQSSSHRADQHVRCWHHREHARLITVHCDLLGAEIATHIGIFSFPEMDC